MLRHGAWMTLFRRFVGCWMVVEIMENANLCHLHLFEEVSDYPDAKPLLYSPLSFVATGEDGWQRILKK